MIAALQLQGWTAQLCRQYRSAQLTSGTFVGEYFDGNDRMDMILKRPPNGTSPEELSADPDRYAARRHPERSASSLIFERTVGPSQLLRRVDGQRTISLAVCGRRPK